MIVVVGGIKGGSGKTTLATNLTVMSSFWGDKILLVDADEQQSAFDWSAQREGMGIATPWCTIKLSGRTLHTELKKLNADYQHVIVDVGGRDTTSQRSALTVAQMFVIPFKPRSLDFWTLGSVKAMINEIRTVNPDLECRAVVNQADSRGQDNLVAIEALKECVELKCADFSIGYRKAYGNAASDGLGVIELKTQDDKVLKEMEQLYHYVFDKRFALTDKRSLSETQAEVKGV